MTRRPDLDASTIPGGDFDIFCSYAHADNDGGWVDRFVAPLATTFAKLTGEVAQIFVDRGSLRTADIWEKKIRAALDASQIMVAVVSPSFVKSEWCRREWEIFAQRERRLRKQKLLPADQGLIVPILLFPLTRGRFDQEEQAFASSISERQRLDVSSQVDGSPVRRDQVRQLAEQIIDTIAELQLRERRAAGLPSTIVNGVTILDPATRLEWTASLSPRAMSYEDAQAYVESLNAATEGGWRLPTKDELESIIDPLALSDDPSATPFPLREPFNSQRFGRLHSGTPIREGNWVMNVANGHIYNGFRVDCYVRAVRIPLHTI